MDRLVNVRFYTVDFKDGHEIAFSSALERASQLSLAEREIEIEPDVIVRLENYTVDGNRVKCELVRVQDQNLPPSAPIADPIEPLGIDRIGHSVAFVYDTDLSIIAWEQSTRAVSINRFEIYLSQLLTISGYSFLPVPKPDILADIREKRVRKITLKVARPDNLGLVSDEGRSVSEGLALMQGIANATQMELSFSMGHATQDLSKPAVLRFIQDLLQARDNDEGASKASVTLKDPISGDTNPLNLFGAHLGDKEQLPLPEDNPIQSYEIRKNYVEAVMNRYYTILSNMFGE